MTVVMLAELVARAVRDSHEQYSPAIMDAVQRASNVLSRPLDMHRLRAACSSVVAASKEHRGTHSSTHALLALSDTMSAILHLELHREEKHREGVADA